MQIMAEDWSNNEVELIIADYFSMLTDEIMNNPVNKTLHRNGLKMLLNNRTDSSIEFKHQNISAVLIKLGLPFIKGYKPRWNFQQILEQKINEYLSKQKLTIESKFIHFAESKDISMQNVDFGLMIDSPPERQHIIMESEVEYQRRPIKINYLEREQSNTSLGSKGEMLVIEYEKWRLINIGKENLAEKIEWIASNDDGAGFDILSKNENGSDRYIEVKTTKLSKDTPIFFSKNEYEFSKRKATDFHLYRLFNFNKTPKMFNVNGSFDEFCSKEAIQYKGYF